MTISPSRRYLPVHTIPRDLHMSNHPRNRLSELLAVPGHVTKEVVSDSDTLVLIRLVHLEDSRVRTFAQRPI